MKVLLVNGSPHKNGCTYTALHEVGTALNANGIDTEWFHIGTAPVRGCAGCGKCKQTGRCVFDDDAANTLAEAIAAADGLVVGSPVYYAGPNGALCALLDRAYFSHGGQFAGKPAAAIASARRAGTTATLDRLNKYFSINAQPVVSSQYWNMVHGQSPEEVRQDEEGLQIMRTLGVNMAWQLKALQQNPLPERKEPPARTNFIR